MCKKLTPGKLYGKDLGDFMDARKVHEVVGMYVEQSKIGEGYPWRRVT